MTERDKENLDFLLNVSEKTFVRWLFQADEDDIEYALELIQQHNKNIITKEILLRDEKNDSEIDTTQAKQILKRFML